MTTLANDAAATLAHALEQSSLTIHDLPAEDRRFELVGGSLIVSPGPDGDHQMLVTDWIVRLLPLVPAGLKVVSTPNIVVSDHTLIIPDVAVVDPAQLLPGRLGWPPAGMVLGIEIASPSTRAKDQTIKRSLFTQWGVPLILDDRDSLEVVGDLPSWATPIGH